MAKAKTKPAKKPSKNGTVKRMEEQPQLPGAEDVKNPKVHGKALAYASVRDERCKLSKEEDEAKTNLREAMIEAGLTRYHYRELTVDLTEKKDVKVKVEKAATAEGDGEE